MFTRGQKVAVKDDTPLRSQGPSGEIVPQLGVVYTVRDVSESILRPGEARIQLMEIVNKPLNYKHGGYGECWFYARDFRPVVDTEKKQSTETGMDILRKLQDPANHRITEDA